MEENRNKNIARLNIGGPEGISINTHVILLTDKLVVVVIIMSVVLRINYKRTT